MMTREPAVLEAPRTDPNELPTREKIMEKAVEIDGCLIWLGMMHRKTGPFMKWHGQQVQPHRVLWLLEYGELPPAHIRRVCPASACIAPAHRKIV